MQAKSSEAPLEGQPTPIDGDGISPPWQDGDGISPPGPDIDGRQEEILSLVCQDTVIENISDSDTPIGLPSQDEFYYNENLSLRENIRNNPKAFIMKVVPKLLPYLRFKDGKLYFEQTEASQVNLMQFRDKSPQAISEHDTPLLAILHSILLAETLRCITSPESFYELFNDPRYPDRSITIRVPDLMRLLGHNANYGKNAEAALIAKILSFSGLMGGIEVKKGNRTYIDYFAVMELRGDLQSGNIIRFASPYLNMGILYNLKASLQLDSAGKPRVKHDGRPLFKPHHCYLVKSSIAKERNKRAIEIVFALAVLIDRAGRGTPHIKVCELIDRCPCLMIALDDAKDTRSKNIVLKRTFAAAWQYMEKHTIIRETYEDIKMPDFIPTMKTLNRTIEFPHKGKKKKAGSGNDDAQP